MHMLFCFRIGVDKANELIASLKGKKYLNGYMPVSIKEIEEFINYQALLHDEKR